MTARMVDPQGRGWGVGDRVVVDGYGAGTVVGFAGWGILRVAFDGPRGWHVEPVAAARAHVQRQAGPDPWAVDGAVARATET